MQRRHDRSTTSIAIGPCAWRVRRVFRVPLVAVGTTLLAVAVAGAMGAATADRVAAPAAPISVPARTAAPAAATLSVPARVAAPSSTPSFALPPPNAGFDYQLGGAYPPPPGVSIVTRDRTDAPSAGMYNVCYVNGFQTQPGESAWWAASHPTLILRANDGTPLIDPAWPGEYILDISTAANRTEIGSIVGAWIDGCATSGFHAAEVDNLDTYTRFASRLSVDDAIAMASVFASRAHTDGLAIAQKNAAELVVRRSELGFDFAVAEQCGEFDECGVFTAGYGDHVLVIEYQRAAFDATCAAFPQLSVVLRDVNLVTPSSGAYVRDAC